MTKADDKKKLLSFTAYSYCCVGVVCSELERWALQSAEPFVFVTSEAELV